MVYMDLYFNSITNIVILFNKVDSAFLHFDSVRFICGCMYV